MYPTSAARAFQTNEESLAARTAETDAHTDSHDAMPTRRGKPTATTTGKRASRGGKKSPTSVGGNGKQKTHRDVTTTMTTTTMPTTSETTKLNFDGCVLHYE